MDPENVGAKTLCRCLAAKASTRDKQILQMLRLPGSQWPSFEGRNPLGTEDCMTREMTFMTPNYALVMHVRVVGLPDLFSDSSRLALEGYHGAWS